MAKKYFATQNIFFAKYPRFSRFSHFCKNAKIFTESQIGFFCKKSNNPTKIAQKTRNVRYTVSLVTILARIFGYFLYFSSKNLKNFPKKFSLTGLLPRLRPGVTQPSVTPAAARPPQRVIRRSPCC